MSKENLEQYKFEKIKEKVMFDNLDTIKELQDQGEHMEEIELYINKLALQEYAEGELKEQEPITQYNSIVEQIKKRAERQTVLFKSEKEMLEKGYIEQALYNQATEAEKLELIESYINAKEVHERKKELDKARIKAFENHFKAEKAKGQEREIKTTDNEKTNAFYKALDVKKRYANDFIKE